MLKGKILPLLAVVGLIMAANTVRKGNIEPPVAEPLAQPARAPYERFVAGAGIVESSSENITIAAPVGALATDVFVKVGQEVKTGDPLFQLDNRDLNAQLLVKTSALDVARAELADVTNQFHLYERVTDRRAVSAEELSRREYGMKVNQAKVRFAEAEIEALRKNLDRLVVRASIDGKVLQIKIRAGEFAPAQVLATPLLVLGRITPLNVRVDVDENDAWRVKEGAPAKAYLRGNPNFSFDLKFVGFEPYVIPKRSLTGDSSERVDTRVLQVVYSMERGDTVPFVGQLVDVFIESKEK